MTTKRATILAINSLTSLPKVRSSSSSSSIKTLILSKNITTTAPQASSNFNPDPLCNYGFDSNSSEYSKNPSLYNDDQNGVEFHHNPVRQNGNISGYDGQTYNGSPQPSRNAGFDGSYRQSDTGYQGSANGNYNSNVGKFHRGVGGNYTGNVGTNQPNGSSYPMSNVGFNYNTVGHFQQHQGGNYQQSGNAGVQTQNSYYNNNGQNFQQNQPENVGNYSNARCFQQVQQNPNDRLGNSGTYQQNDGYHWNSNSIIDNTVRTFQPGGYNYDNTGYNTNSGSHYNVSGTFDKYAPIESQTSNGDTVEPIGNQYRGTIEEFDGFCKEGKVKEAMEVLELLQKQQINIDLPQYLCLVKACGEAGALEEAKAVHKLIAESISPLKVSTYNKILEMYAKCESIDEAKAVFESMPIRNLTTWDIMVTWFTKNGRPQEAIDLFEQFKKSNLKPDGEIFIGVFAAYSVLGEIEEGMLQYDKMINEYNIVPTMKHYVSVVDMLGNAGYIDEAFEFIEKLPIEPSVEIYETLMNVCRIQGSLELGDRCAEIVDQLDPTRLTDQSKKGLIPIKPSEIAKEIEKKKLASQKFLEVKSRVHEYRAGDTSHPENDRIYTLLRGLRQQMKEAGYIAETRFVLHDIDQEGKEDALLAHSERLAVAYGLFTTAARTPIRVIKNLRVCGDCHNACKIISKIVGRQLIMRDAKRFHHIEHGVCSCRDYW